MCHLGKKLKVALLFPRSAEKNYHPPLGPAYLAAVLRQAGHEVMAIDAAAPKICCTDQDIKDMVDAFNPDIVGISFNIYLALNAYALSRVLSSSKYLLLAGGPHATTCAGEVLKNNFDFAVRGEGETAMLALAERVGRGEAFTDLAGISYLKNGRVISNPEGPLISDLDAIPYPAVDLFPRAHYEQTMSCQHGGYIVTSRGCPFSCGFCFKTFGGRSYRIRSAENILKEMNHANRQYGVEDFYIVDETFTVDPRRVQELSSLMEKNPKPYRWMTNSRVDTVDRTSLKQLKKAGCYALAYGFESGDQESLNRISKDASVEKAEEVIRWTQEAGIDVRGYIMIGFPWETTENAENTYRFVRRNQKNICSYLGMAFAIPFPGTNFYNDHKDEHQLEGWWLNQDIINCYALGDWLPIHHKIYFNDIRLLRRDYLFPHDKKTKKVYKRIAKLMGDTNFQAAFPPERYSPSKRCIIYFIIKSSQFLFHRSPKLCYLYMRMLLPFAKRYTKRLYELLK